MASSSSAAEFDVLLSFGEEDEGSRVFAEQLFEALHERDIRVRPANEVGETNAADVIEASSICIPIFCNSYAYSGRCLGELSEVIARKKIILPVFYGVDPSDVRRQRGPFEPAFRDHKLRLDERTVQKWGDALEEAGEIVGYVVADVAGDG